MVLLCAGGCGSSAATDPPSQTFGARVSSFSLSSRLVGQRLREVVVSPRPVRGGRPLLLLLPGRGMSPYAVLTRGFLRTLSRLRATAPNVVIADGGDHSYFHDRADGRWGSSVTDELLPAALARTGSDSRRIALGGLSMGGFGALNIARLHPGRFCAIGAHSPALWKSAGETAPGAFDDATDFSRNDVLALARRQPQAFGGPRLWIDLGRDDPFHAATAAFAQALRAGAVKLTFREWPGGHGQGYWDQHLGTYLRFYARSLADCRAD